MSCMISGPVASHEELDWFEIKKPYSFSPEKNHVIISNNGHCIESLSKDMVLLQLQRPIITKSSPKQSATISFNIEKYEEDGIKENNKFAAFFGISKNRRKA